MQFSNFLFPESRVPDTDSVVIHEALREAELCDALGFEVLWLAEHHFDGGCAYVDPMTFAAAVAARTTQIRIGFAVAQMALHHPVRLAEQVALIDNISRGRIIVGLGRGTAYNFYEYRGYGIAPQEAQARLIESEDILVNAWTTPAYKHQGTFWQLDVPLLRPQVYQKPHPPLIRACSGLDSTLAMARQGRPFMMNIQSDAVTRERFELYRQTMAEAGYDEATITQTLGQCWAWRNIVVANTDAEAEAIAIPAFRRMREHLNAARRHLNTAAEQAAQHSSGPAARETVEHGVIYGSPATVCEKLAPLQGFGLGGLIIHFRLGPMSWEATEQSIRLFAQHVAPEFRHGRRGAAL